MKTPDSCTVRSQSVLCPRGAAHNWLGCAYDLGPSLCHLKATPNSFRVGLSFRLPQSRVLNGSIVKEVRWHNFAEVRSTFKDADNVNGYMIFNIRRNRYRLVTVIHYAKTTDQKRTQGHVYIRSFLTHKEYDNPGNWDRRFGTK
jgi:mRNA interferase HigB